MKITDNEIGDESVPVIEIDVEKTKTRTRHTGNKFARFHIRTKIERGRPVLFITTCSKKHQNQFKRKSLGAGGIIVRGLFACFNGGGAKIPQSQEKEK